MGDFPAPGGATPSLGAVLLSGRSITELLELVVAVTVAAVEEVTAVSVTYRMETGRGYRTISSSSAEVEELDGVQYASGGPCVSALESGEQRKVSLPTDRYPAFSSAAVALGMTTVWSLPLRPDPTMATIGALNLYSSTARPWRDEVAAPVLLLAEQAAVLLANAATVQRAEQLSADLTDALASRTVIGQAQGVLMLRQQIDADAAFEVLRRASQRSNRKLRDIAADIVASVIQPTE
jgi:GAF domain-containing protein